MAFWFRRGEARLQSQLTQTFAALRQSQRPVLEAARPVEEFFVYPDFVDREALTELADLKGVEVDPRHFDIGLGESRSRATTVETHAELAIPTVGSIGETTGEQYNEERSITRSVGFQRRRSTRTIVDEIIGALAAEGSLHRDIALVPASCRNEAGLIRGLRQALYEWGLAEIEIESQASSEETDDAVEAVSNQEREVAEAIRIVEQAAVDVMCGIKIDEYGELISSESTAFGLATTMWHIHRSGDTVNAHSSRLALDETLNEDALAPFLMSFSVDIDQIRAMSRDRYQEDAFLDLQVFCRIDSLDEHATLRLVPIAIFSR